MTPTPKPTAASSILTTGAVVIGTVVTDVNKIGTSNREDLKSALRGSIAALVNITITFPINKIIFRQQLGGISITAAANELRKEGIGFLYRGVAPPMLQQMVSKGIMFGLYDKYGTMYSRIAVKYNMTAQPIQNDKFHFNSNCWKNVDDVAIGTLAAASSGMTELVLLPFERIQSVLQISKYHDKYHNTYHAFLNLSKDGSGVREYFRGFTACAARNMSASIIFFGTRGHVKNYLNSLTSQENHESHTTIIINNNNTTSTKVIKSSSLFKDFIGGAVLGSAISTITYPLNVTKNVMQRQIGGNITFFTTCMMQTFNERGRSIPKMYGGLSLNIIRSFMSWGIINVTIELLKDNGF